MSRVSFCGCPSSESLAIWGLQCAGGKNGVQVALMKASSLGLGGV